MRMRVARGALLSSIGAVIIALSGCADDKPSETQQQRVAATPAAVRQYHATRAQLQTMRDKWGASIMMLDTPAANVLGVMQQVADNGDESRDYPVLTDSPDVDAAVDNLPRDWQSARVALQGAGDAIGNARHDFQTWKDGADFDDGLRSKFDEDKIAIVDSLCNALREARRYYAAAGGYANDLSFVLLSDKGDRACQNVAMAHPYTTTMKRRGLATIAASTNEMPEANTEEAFVDDHAGFIVPPGTAVQVIGHRYYDSSEILLCQIHGGGGTGWVPCAWLTRAPRASDG